MGHTAVIAGATGLIGGELVRGLLEDPFFDQVIALVRKETGLAHEKLIQVVTDYEALEDAVEQYLSDAYVFCCLGTTIKKAGSKEQFRKVDYEYPMLLGRLALRYGAAEYLIVTSMGANAGSAFFYNQVKGEVEEGLSKLQLPSLQIFRPSLLLGDRQEVRLGERFGTAVSRVVTPIMIGALRKYRPIQAQIVAKAMLQSSKKSNKGTWIYESDQIEELIK
ncbi:oxidoreductase [Paenibacillus radicis (ex Xue et al. 2023)]|uniref:Oxidoreductase n=1 Tax=Paenibacillus radicis (ex Xue et al. 2023) TaxID=2972489 RepID=A0ABT1YSL5_9BACL|nr:oxidoreductase [Paenibacillus radicis (ex Xue et al. 2023)]MCR8635278.1 oxidoreductase [Paenibacillus radicis (ex Xue et al. 2023)]